MTRNWFQLAVAVALVAYATLTRADEPCPLELDVATGYTQGHGPAAGGMMPGLEDLAGGGGALRLGVGWRIAPRWTAGTYFEASRLGSGEQGTDGMTSFAAGLQGQLHLAPASRLDPWIGLGAGWRGLWLEHAAGTHVLQGLDLARVEAGLDWRVSDRLAVAPVVGLSFTEMLSEKGPGASGYSDVQDRDIGQVLFVGVNGRFDVFGSAPGVR
jgi:hypothetical protein